MDVSFHYFDLFANPTEWRISLITSIYYAGQLVSSYMIAIVLKYVTYKQLMVSSAAALTIIGSVYSIPVGWIFLAILRFLVALPVYLLVQCVPIWLAPHADPDIRGRLSVIIQVGFNFGMICSGLLLWAIFSPYPYNYDKYDGKLYFIAFLPNILISSVLVSTKVSHSSSIKRRRNN